MAYKALEGIIDKNITRYREVAGLTQATLARKIGINTTSVSRVERRQRRMRMEMFHATTKALDANVDALLSMDSSAT